MSKPASAKFTTNDWPGTNSGGTGRVGSLGPVGIVVRPTRTKPNFLGNTSNLRDRVVVGLFLAARSVTVTFRVYSPGVVSVPISDMANAGRREPPSALLATNSFGSWVNSAL